MITLDHIQQALNLTQFDSHQAQMSMSPAGRENMRPKPDNPPRQSAVLILIYPKHDDLTLLLTKRNPNLRGHSGQVSFPGGRCDDTDTSIQHTALRETCEEVGICDSKRLTVIGQLTKMWIPPSNYDVHPFVATTPEQPQFIPNPDEVASILELPLIKLIDDATKKITQMDFRQTTFDVPYYDVSGEIVWGATAGMLAELEHRLKYVLD